MKKLVLTFFIIVILIPLSGYADTWTQTSTADFDAGTKSNVQVIANSVTLDYNFPSLSNDGGGTWSYRKAITIDNTGGGTLTNYQIFVILDTDTLVTAGKMQDDGDDIRFTDSDGDTEISNYWIEGAMDSTTNKIWIKVPSIAASSNHTIYVYYGNPSATAASSGSNTFDFFDDFNILDGVVWTQTGTASSDGDILSVDRGAVYSDAVIGSSPQNFTFEAAASYSQVNKDFAGICISDSQSTGSGNSGSDKLAYTVSDDLQNAWIMAFAADGSAANYNICTDTTDGDNIYASMAIGTDYIMGFSFNSTSQIIHFINTATYDSAGAYTTLGSTTYADTWTGNYYMWLGYMHGSASGTTDCDNFDVDWVRVRKYTATVPSTSAGSETRLYATSGTLTSSIFDASATSYGTMTWTDSGVQTLTMKVRTSNDSGMSGATAWASCTNVTKGNDITALSSVTDTHQYIQYQAAFSTGDTAQTPTLDDVSINYVSDGTPPSSTISVPVNGNNYSSFTTISGTASDDISGVASVAVSIQKVSDSTYWDGDSWEVAQTWLAATGTTSWTYTYTPDTDDENYTVQSRATDNASNVETPGAGNTFYYNSVAPSSTITVPVSGNYYSAQAGSTLTTISGTATVSVGSITQVDITIKNTTDGTWWTGATWGAETWLLCTGKTSWTYTAPTWTDAKAYLIKSRAQTSTVTETPGAGNTFTYDASAPSSSVTSPADAAVLGSLTTISGTASDSLSGVSNVGVSIKRTSDNKYWDGDSWEVTQAWLTATGTTSWTYSYTPPADGNYVFQSRGTDDVGNVETPGAGNTISYDTTAPASAVGSPVNGTTVGSLTTISGAASDAIAGVSSVGISIKRTSDNKYWDGDSWESSQTWLTATGTTSWTYSYTPDADGTYLFQSRATDAVTNVETAGAGNTVSYDTTAPSSTVTAPADSVNLNALTEVTGTASDAIAGVNKVEVSIQKVSDSTYWDGDSWEVAQTWLTATGTMSWTYTWTPSVDDENYTVQSRATDDVGNVETPGSGNTFYYSTTAPVSSITAPTSGGYYSAETGYTLATITGTASILTGSITLVEITIKNTTDGTWWTGATWGAETWLTATGTTAWTYTAPAWTTAKAYLVRSRATAIATETPAAGKSFTYDTAAPADITDLAASVGSIQGYIDLTWTAPSDALSGTDSYTVKYATYAFADSVGGTSASWWTNAVEFTQSWTVSSAGSTESQTVTGLTANLTYYFAIKTTDAVGNVSGVSNQPSGNTSTPPVVTVTYPTDSGVTVGSLGDNGSSTINITWTVTDPNTSDTHTFAVAVSSDLGVSYTTLTSSLPDGTTYYGWDSLGYNNTFASANYKVRVIATDSGSLTGEDTSDNNFSLDNANLAPTVTVTYPNGGETLSGSKTITWTNTDSNTNDTHTYDVYYSVDSGTTYTLLAADIPNGTLLYAWDTTSTADSNTYKIKVFSTDDGGATGYPSKTSSDASNAVFSVNNVNDAPDAFDLLTPTNADSVNSLTPILDWEDATDQDTGQILTYTLEVATDVAFANLVINKADITQSIYYVTVADGLVNNSTYYWRVKVTDDGTPAESTYSTQTTWSFTTSDAVPSVSSTSPTNNAKVLTDDVSSVTVRFTKRIDEATLTASTVTIVDNESNAVTVTLSYDDSNQSVTITPASAFTASRIYTVTLTTGITDLSGTAMAAAYSFSFKTLIYMLEAVTFTAQSGKVECVLASNSLSEDSYIIVEEKTSTNSTPVASANNNVNSDSRIASVGVSGYELNAYDSDDTLVEIFNTTITLSLYYNDTDSDGYVDSTSVKETLLRMFKLNETTNNWELVDDSTVDETNNKVSAEIESFSTYTLLGYKAPSDTASGLMNFPNPFEAGQESTTIVYVLNKDAKVTIYIYNIVGDLVKKLEYASGSTGGTGASGGYTNRVTWDGRNGDGMIVANGGYIAQVIVEPEDGTDTVKMIRKIAVVK
ncbi:MAG: DUF2341 domain-containing protein [bacterium]